MKFKIGDRVSIVYALVDDTGNNLIVTNIYGPGENILGLGSTFDQIVVETTNNNGSKDFFFEHGLEKINRAELVFQSKDPQDTEWKNDEIPDQQRSLKEKRKAVYANFDDSTGKFNYWNPFHGL